VPGSYLFIGKKSLFLIFLYISDQVITVIERQTFTFGSYFYKIKSILIYSTMKNDLKKQEIMKGIIPRLYLIIILFIIAGISSFAQDITQKPATNKGLTDSLKKNAFIFNDSIRRPDVILSADQAVAFLRQRLQPGHWKDINNPFRRALEQLIFESTNPPYDSAKMILKNYPYDSLNIPWKKFFMWEPLKSEFPGKEAVDSTNLVAVDTLDDVASYYPGFPFKYFIFPYQSDSIKVAVNSLMNYLEQRDSTIINFTGIGNNITPVWMNKKSGRMTRYWLKNELSDSVTIWIGNTARDTIGLYLEKGVSFIRPARQGNYSAARINVQAPDRSKLLNARTIDFKTRFWKYRSENSFILSQTAMSNWVRGGENSISTSIDITGYADYVNKPLKVSSNNFIRLKLGFIKSGENPLIKNLDLFETNSKLNHKAFGRFDFSAILLFKTQIARGYSYDTDPPVLVSKFFNPAVITVGFGLDYKPNKTTSLNLSPLSYRGTFVCDTAEIDQTKYGIGKQRTSLNEPGASFMITNESRPFKNVKMVNRLQLFTNYINKPQNVDVDWEMIADVNLNWFTDLRFNTHLIFDDDTRTAVIDKDRKPVLLPDGSLKKTARIQFKELLGISFVFRF
jgi:Protein of unknown function (DUF3078)